MAAVAAAARRTVVVVNAATPVLMPWAEQVDAILVAGLPGQEGGHAVADALLGRREPAGRLVTTWPAADGATPAWSVTPVDGALAYAEGTFVGYRGHAAGRAPEPPFWFGHGLGYGAWDYLDARVDDSDDAPRGHRHAAQHLRPRAPARSCRSTSPPPTRSSRSGSSAGRRRTSRPAAAAEVVVRCDPRMWRRWDADAGGWAALERRRTPRRPRPRGRPAPPTDRLRPARLLSRPA